ncbi:MAG: hypothetical protein QOF68_3190 [Gaiellales bacterium]|nr:hypothetical protein [Gaiellales bacterium]
MGRFTGRVAIVTGGASGIGEATAHRLANEGASVIVADIDAARGETVAAVIGEAGGTARFRRCDVASAEDWQAMAAETVGEFGRIDIVHNNAYTTVISAAEKVSEADWDRTFDVCVKAIFLSAKACMRHLTEASGAMVNTASVHALMSFAGYAAYDSAKAAICGLTRNLAVEYGPAVRVNAVLPGAVITPAWDGRSEADRDAFASEIVAGRLGTADEIAAAVAFLASADASYITGAMLVVDGGLTITKNV